MENYGIELANDHRTYDVVAARWECSEDYTLTSFDDEGNVINTWEPTEWHRLIERDGNSFVDKFRNPFVPKTRVRR